MPRGDRTGPNGTGPMTGRRAGFCAGYQVPGFMNPIQGRGYGFGFGRGAGFGRGRGRGRGFGAVGQPVQVNWGYQPSEISPDEEKQMLASQVESLQQQLEAVSSRLAELEGK